MADARDKKNVLVLAACQAIFNSARGLTFLAASLVGANLLGDDLTFFALPLTVMLVGTAGGSVPAARLMGRIGRKLGFFYGSLIGTLGGGIAATAVNIESFALFNVGMFFIGIYSSFAQQYRFAVADAAADDFKAKAISLVLAAGVIGAFVGPETARFTRELFAGAEFTGTFVAMMVFALLTGVVALGIDIPKLTLEERKAGGRDFTEIALQPTFIVAAISATLGYMIMNILMISTPIAMKLGSGMPFGDTVLVIEWHVVGMFAPGFFTGSLINRFGVLRIIAAGCVMLVLAVVTALAGDSFTHYLMALFFVGVGWNFTFTGGTVLLTEVHTPAERPMVQGNFDLIVFSGMAISSLSSGALYNFFGWSWVNLAALPMILIVLLAAIWLSFHRRGLAATPPPCAGRKRNRWLMMKD
ncbi:MAG: MFS transporter [Proteobacteria bacterium]|nr:MFS transporter [Pseudomonadota bacterium]